MLKFDDETASLLDDAYQGADLSRRRRASYDAVDPQPDDYILDLGCGNGLLTLELARTVGPMGRICGLDPSPEMLAAATKRCVDRPNITLDTGVAENMPYEDASFDKAVSIQVFEYFPDMRPALSELKRVLRPDGRLVISDIHFDSWIWHSDNPDRMAVMQKSWDGHLAERCIPQLLPERLTAAGFNMQMMIPVTFCDTRLRADGIAAMMIRLMVRYAVSTGAFSQNEADAWADEQFTMARDGRFFFSITQFVCVSAVA